MATKSFTTSKSANALGPLACVLLAACLLIIAFMASVAGVFGSRRGAALDPLPAVRWDVTQGDR